MAKRLQVILQDPEYREIQRVARSRRMTIAEWVRQTRFQARRNEPLAEVEEKPASVRHEFPAGDIEDILAEIERGCGKPLEP